jgi:hypothetical protein
MSKNTNTSGFRKIDIDAFDPENYKDDDDQNNQSDERGPNEQEITNLLNSLIKFLTFYFYLSNNNDNNNINRKKNVDALQAVLNNPPLNSKNQAIKVAYHI